MLPNPRYSLIIALSLSSVLGSLPAIANDGDWLPSAQAASLSGDSDGDPVPSDIPSNPAVQELINQVRFWLNRDRPDLAQLSVNKLARVASDNSDIYAAQALVDVRTNQRKGATELLAKIRAIHPDSPDIAEIEQALRGKNGGTQASLHQADQLARIGKVDEALRVFRTTFPQGIPENHVVDYWRLMARTPNGRPAAIRAMETLLHDYPGNPEYQLELACLRTARYPWPKTEIDVLAGLSRDTEYGPRARSCWRDAVLDIPSSDGSGLIYLKTYLEQNPDDLGAKEHWVKNQQTLAHLHQLMADPMYQEKLSGLGYYQDGDYEQARKKLLIAYKKYPHDVEIVGGIGKTLLKQSRDSEATPWFRQARQLEPDAHKKWDALIFTSIFWGDLQEAGRLRQAGHFDQAENKVQEALRMDPQQLDARAQLIRLKVDEVQFAQAINLASQMPEPQQSDLLRDIHASDARYLHKQADLNVAAGHPDHAYRYLQRAHDLNPLDPWVTYDLAEMEVQQGRTDAANQLFVKLVQAQPTDPSTLYADSLFLSKRDRNTEALNTLEQIAPDQRDTKIMALQRRLWVSWQLDQARAYANQGNQDQARKTLTQVQTSVGPEDVTAQTDVAFVWLALGDQKQARTLLDKVRQNHPDLPAAWHLRYAHFLEEAGPSDAWQNELASLDKAQLTPEEQTTLTQLHTDMTLREVRARLAKGDVAGANLLVKPLLAANAQSADVLDVSSQVAQRNGQLDEAIQDLQQSLSNSPDKTDYRYKRLAKMLDERTTWVAGGLDDTQRSGTAGQSQLNAYAVPVEVRTPLAVGGELVLRSDQVNISAGAINQQNTYATKTFGSMLLCQPNCSTAFLQQNATGRSYMVGYDNQDLHASVGTTPIGFAVTNWVGDIKNRGDWGQASWSLDAGRQPLTSTLLSFAGTRDPRTGMIWGGVLTTGVTLGLSLDHGETNGFWSNFSAYELTGTNVQSNTSLRMMAGWTHRIINEDDRLFSSGLSAMLWHFNQDSGEFTLGQGGYYSPQRYASLGVPLTYAQRYQRFSYMVHGSVFASWAQINASPYYPTDPLLQAQTGNPYYSASAGSSLGYSAVAAWEYQATPSLFVGNRWEIQRSPYYSPNSVLLYMRYAFDHSAAMPVLLQPDALQPTYPFY